MSKCSQCDREAMYNVQGHSLCLHCAAKIQQLENEAQSQRMAMINYLSEQMRYTTGLTDRPPRLEIARPTYQNIPINKLNHILVDRSTVGTISTGDFATIDSNLNSLYVQGQENLGNALKEFTNEVIKATELQADNKKEIIEQLSFITSLLQNRDAKKSIITPLWESIKNKVSAVNSLLSLYNNVSRLIDTFC